MIVNGHDLYELSADEAVFFRKAYRTLRIRVPYGPPGDPCLDGARAEGMFYGMTRQEAKDAIYPLMKDLNWYGYLGSK